MSDDVTDKAARKAAKREHRAQLNELELAAKNYEVGRDYYALQSMKVAYKETRRKRADLRDKDDFRRGAFQLVGTIDGRVNDLIRELERYDRTNPDGPVTVQIQSFGGSVFHGFALYDVLRSLSARHDVTTVVRGFAASMAGILFLAGDTRIVGHESMIHAHEPSTYIGQVKAGELEDETALIKHLQEKIKTIYTTRSKVSATQFDKKVRRTEWWMDAAEAVKFGIATEIL